MRISYWIILILFWLPMGITQALAQEYKTDSLKENSIVHKPRRKGKITQWIVPSILTVGGSLMAMDKDADESFITNYELWEERNEKFINFSNHIDDYLQHVPSATAFTLSICGIKGKNDLPNQIALYIKSELLMAAIVFPVKTLAGETRPDTGKKNSFPSGHTASAFAAATFFSKEYGYRSIWYSVGAYTVATTVGVFRILNNRHWLSDILAGAGIGILSTNIVYATHQYRWGKNKKTHLTFSPTYYQGAVGGYVQVKF